jgi:signal transduction histidine kinase
VNRLAAAGCAGAMAAGLVVDLSVLGAADVGAWLPDVAVGWAFLGGALVLCLHGRAGRMALLLGLTGAAWFAGTLVPALVFLHRGPLVHLLFGYPTGRLSGVGRFAVPLAYLVSLPPGVWGSEPATIALTGALLVAVEVHRRAAVGPIRRARRQAAVAVALVVAVVVGSACARLLFPQGDADRLTLLVYAAALMAVAIAVTRGVLRATWRRAPVTDLVVQLGGDRAEAVRDALARALGDPSLEVGYRDGNGFVDAAGRPVGLPAADSPRASTVVEQRGEPVAVLVHDRSVLADAALLDAVAVAARLAVRNDKLRAHVEARVADLEDSRRRLVAAADTEQGRLAERLDDSVLRRLSALRHDLVGTEVRATADTAGSIAQALAQLDRTRRDLEDLATGLHPVPDGDLVGALTGLAARTPVPVRVTAAGPPVPPDVAAALWFVAAEVVANTVKHAHATRIDIALTVERGTAGLAVADDGCGGADPDGGSGLRGLADRIEALDGSLSISSPQGRGTTVLAVLPTEAVS